MGASPPKRRQMQRRDAVETKKTSDAATRTQNMRGGNETGCVHKSRGALFDIVKQDGGGDRARPAMRDNGGGGGRGTGIQRSPLPQRCRCRRIKWRQAKSV